MTGATLKQLQWWDETGAIRATIVKGNNRAYSEAQVRQAYLLANLRKRSSQRAPLPTEALCARYALFSVDGKYFWQSDDAEKIITLAASLLAPVVVIDMEPIETTLVKERLAA